MPPGKSGGWTPELIWLHVGSDLFTGLAYLSIPLVLLYLVRKRSSVPFPRLFGLFAAFILACGFTHFLDAMMFHQPLYRLGGLVKLVTAAVSWAAVLALISAAPRVMDAVATVPATDDTALHRPVSGRRDARKLDYIVAILAAV
ncbi:MAG TPA: hypothetical protein VMZ71_06640, partial [Gemmataceae bacterium]|nr:hypothetical protein [Gemmataceae bacterium]